MCSSWSPEERIELVKDLAEWQERDEEIGAAGIKILTETSAPGGEQIELALLCNSKLN